jgi:hypothetical protein
VQRLGTNSGYNTCDISFITSNNPGVVSVQVGDSGSTTCLNRGKNIMIGTGPTMTFECLVVVPVMSVGDEFTFRIGLGDQFTESTDNANGVYLEYNSDGPNWQAKCMQAGTVTQVDTGVAVSFVWTRIRCVINSQEVDFNIHNDTTQLFDNVATVTTNIPSSTVGVQMKIDKNNGTSIVTAAMDYWYHQFTGLSR